MSRLDRYIIAEFLKAFGVGLVTATLLVLALQIQRSLGDRAQAQLGMAWILKNALYGLPMVLEQSMAVATALGASLCVNRLSRDNEITVLRSAGRSVARIFAPIVWVGVVLTVLAFGVSNWLEPWSVQKTKNMQQPSAIVGQSEPGNTVRAGESGEWMVSFRSGTRLSETRRELRGLLLLHRPAPVELITAGGGVYDDATGRWTLTDPVTHRYDSSNTLLSERRDKTRSLTIRADLSREFSFFNTDLNPGFSYTELTRAADAARRAKDWKKAISLETARWFKFALPAMCVVFTLLSPPLSMMFARAGSMAGILLSVIAVFIAWNTILLMKSFALAGWSFLPPVACAFFAHGVFTVVALVLLRTRE